MSDSQKHPLPALPATVPPTVYPRVLLKLSGEACGPAGGGGISIPSLASLAAQLKRVLESGVQLAIVVGGGNILRGRDLASAPSIAPATAHYMGMAATVINGLALQDSLEYAGIPTRLQTAIRMENVAEPFIRRRCIRHLEKGRVVILAGGTGSPFCTTDTAAALRAREIGAHALLKATRVDGVYSDDPLKNPHAERYGEITYQEMIDRKLGVMDAQAIHHCQEADMPIVVFNYQKGGNIERVLAGQRIGTRVLSPQKMNR